MFAYPQLIKITNIEIIWLKEWILKPAVGLLLGWFLVYSRRKYQTYQFRKKYSISGSYVGYAEGYRDGSVVIEKEVLTLQQSVSRITGEAKTVDGNRVWSVKGEILDGGCVSGSYASKSLGNSSRGTFFLEPFFGTAGEYQGVWAGYDASHKMISSGSYKWRKVSKARISRLKIDESKHKALAILQLSLGKNYINVAEFENYCRNENTRIALGAYQDRELIGVGLAKIMDEAEIRIFDQAAKRAGARLSLSTYGWIGHMQSIAIDERFRNHGIGTELCMKCIEYLRQQKCTAVFAVAWQPGPLPNQLLSPPKHPVLAGPSEGMLKTAGFEPVAVIEEFWKVDDPEKDHQCPRCGFPCICTAVFCIKRV